MTAPFLSGILAAWTATQLALSLFFLMAFALGRREREYALFGLLCAALAIVTGAAAFAYAHESTEVHLLALKIAHVGSAFGAVLNLHFVLHYVKIRLPRLVLPLFYGIALISQPFNLGGLLWASYELGKSNLLGYQIAQLRLSPSPWGVAFYTLVGAQFGAALLASATAFRSGKRETLALMVGALVMTGAVANDILLASGAIKNSTYLSPHAFMFYAFAIASTLLLRYSFTAERLTVMADSLGRRSEELRRSHAELQELQEELTSKKQLAAVGEMAASIAHEVRNPLAVISNAVSGLRRQTLPESDREVLLGIVDEEAVRLNRLVTDLLRFARPVRIKRSQIAISELARLPEGSKRGLHTLEVSLPNDAQLQAIYVDPGLFRLVFDSLLDNACQAMKSGGAIHVEVHREGGVAAPFVRIDIRDSGPGMEPEVRKRALDPFFTTRPSGTGLGLPIVQRILEAHGGRLELESERQAGTTVRLFVPMAKPANEPEVLQRPDDGRTEDHGSRTDCHR